MFRLDNVKVILVLVTIIVGVVRCRNHEYMNPEWVDPHDWSGGKESLQICPKCERTARPEYLRLVNSIFDPSHFRKDESTDYLYRTVHIHLTKEQLDKLASSKDPIFIDGLVSDILSQTNFGTVQLVKEYTIDVASTIWNHLPSLPSIPSVTDINFNELPRSRPIFINFLIIVLTYFLCRRYGVNFLVALIFMMVYCLYEYLDAECHKRIEVNEAVEFFYGQEKNPCLSPAKMKWYDWLLGRDGRSECRDFLARQKDANKNQCGVIDLFHEFFTSVVMKQLKLFFLNIAELVHSISSTNGILITIVTLYFMKDLLVTIIQSMFRYILNPTVWSRVASDINNSPKSEEVTSPIQRLQSNSDSDSRDIRDINIGKALDLANKQMKFLLENSKVETSQIQPSGIEVLAVKACASNESENALISTTSAETASARMEPSEGSTDSYEEFAMEELVGFSHKVSLVSVSDSLPSTVSISDGRGSELSSEYSGRMSTDSAQSAKTTDRSEFSSSSSSDSTKLSSDSVEILSISSDTTSS